MRSARVPNQEIARISAELLPLEPLLLQILHSVLCETIPLRRPRWDSLLVRELLMKLFGEQVAAAADYETTIVWPIWQQIDQALKTAEAGSRWILVLVWPWRVRRQVLTAVQ